MGRDAWWNLVFLWVVKELTFLKIISDFYVNNKEGSDIKSFNAITSSAPVSKFAFVLIVLLNKIWFHEINKILWWPL